MIRRWVLGAAGMVALFGLAQLGVWLSGVGPDAFPLPSSVIAQAWDLPATSAFTSSVGSTMAAWAEAMVITIAIGVPVGLLLGMLPAVEAAIRPVLEFLRPIPSVVLIPLVLLVVQDNQRTQVAVIVFAAVWPVLINTVYGLREVDPAAKETLRGFGFGSLGVAWYVQIPSAAPFIATGARIAASQAFVIAIAAELVGTQTNGLGSYAAQAQAAPGALTVMIAVAVWSGIIGVALNGLFSGVERRAFRWHYELSGGRR